MPIRPSLVTARADVTLPRSLRLDVLADLESSEAAAGQSDSAEASVSDEKASSQQALGIGPGHELMRLSGREAVALPRGRAGHDDWGTRTVSEQHRAGTRRDGTNGGRWRRCSPPP